MEFSDKLAIRIYLQEHYTDERLAALLAHARDGKLNYNSCCCFIGAANSNHAIQTRYPRPPLDTGHFLEAMKWEGAFAAHMAYAGLGDESDRRRVLIPMIRAEMKRRENLRAKQIEISDAQTVAVRA